MAKKLDAREYEAELIKVLDGDTIDCYIDLGFDLKIKKRIRYMGIDTWESRTRDLDEKKKDSQQRQEIKNYLNRVGLNSSHSVLVSLVEYLEKSLYHLNTLGIISTSVLLVLIVQLIYRLMVG